jgi:hypothetical protein
LTYYKIRPQKFNINLENKLQNIFNKNSTISTNKITRYYKYTFQELFKHLKTYVVLKFRTPLNNFFVSVAKKTYMGLRKRKIGYNLELSNFRKNLRNYMHIQKYALTPVKEFYSISKFKFRYTYFYSKDFLYNDPNYINIDIKNISNSLKKVNIRILNRYFRRAARPWIKPPRWKKLLKHFNYNRKLLFNSIYGKLIYKRRVFPSVLTMASKFLKRFKKLLFIKSTQRLWNSQIITWYIYPKIYTRTWIRLKKKLNKFLTTKQIKKYIKKYIKKSYKPKIIKIKLTPILRSNKKVLTFGKSYLNQLYKTMKLKLIQRNPFLFEKKRLCKLPFSNFKSQYPQQNFIKIHSYKKYSYGALKSRLYVTFP